MKSKRIFCFIMLLFLGIAVPSVSALAFANNTIKSEVVDISLSASLSFVSHNAIFPDKVVFYAAATGDDTYMLNKSVTDVTVYVQPKTDTVDKSEYYLTYPNNLTINTSVNCDKKGTCGKLKMHCVDVDYTLVTYD